MKVERRAGSLLLVLAVVIAACSGGSDDKPSTPPDVDLVASVGGRPVTKSYFEDRLEKMERQFLPDTLDLAGKKKFLEFILNKEIMALKAEELGYDQDAQLQSNLNLLETSLVHRNAQEEVTRGKTEATEEEIQEWYNRKQNSRHVQHILLSSREKAQEVHDQIKAGTDFQELVASVSEVPREDQHGVAMDDSQRGAFGLVAYGTTQPWVEKAIFDTPLGEITEPIQTSYGWHIFKPVREEATRQTPLSDQRKVIKQQIELRKRRAVLDVYYEGILADHGYKLYDDAIKLIMDNLPPDLDPSEAPDPRTEVKPVIPFSIEDRAKPLFEVDGKITTIGDFSDHYDETNWFERPKRWSGGLGLKYWIRDGWLKDLQLERARADNVHLLPAVVDEGKFRREQMMVSALHNNLIGSQIPEPTDDDINAFYEERRETNYLDKEKRVCNVIFHNRERVVRRAYEEVVAGADFVETAIRYSETATEASEVQTPGFAVDNPDFEEIAPKAFALGDKEYTEPFRTNRGWVCLQLYAVVPARPFELEQIREFVIRDIKNQWSEDRLNELLEDWKESIDIQVYDDVLATAEVRRDDVYVPGVPATGGGDAAEGASEAP